MRWKNLKSIVEIDTTDGDWTAAFPEEDATMWLFFGYLYGKTKENEPELVTVECWQTADAYVCVSGASFIYKSEAVGLWKRLELPKMPSSMIPKV